MKTLTNFLGVSNKVIIALVTVYLLWGSTYLGIAFAVETIPPFLMCGVRFVIAGLIVFAWSRYRGAAMPTLLHWRSAAIVGGLLLLGGNGSLAWAEQRVPSGIAALIVASAPLWLVLLDWLWHKSARPRPRVFAGLALGFAGIALLANQNPGDGHQAADLIGVLMILFASFSWALGSIYSKGATLPDNALMSISIQMIAGGVILVLFSGFMGEWQSFDAAAVSAKSLGALLYLVVFGAIIGFSCYLWLLREAPAEMVATYAYVNPVVAVFLGWWLASEAITGQTLLASAIIIASVVMITGRKKSQRNEPIESMPSKPLPDILEEPQCARESL